MNVLQDGDGRPKLLEKLRREAHMHRTMVIAGAERASGQQLAAVAGVAPRSVAPPPKVSPPFWGTRIVPPEDLALRDIFDCLDLIELYKLQWGVKVKSREMYQKLIADEFAGRRHGLQEECIRNGWLEPKVVAGSFPCAAEGNDLTVLDPSTRMPIWTFHV